MENIDTTKVDASSEEKQSVLQQSEIGNTLKPLLHPDDSNLAK
jgi:hypothetical protein